jgi:hypothetical protein
VFRRELKTFANMSVFLRPPELVTLFEVAGTMGRRLITSRARSPCKSQHLASADKKTANVRASRLGSVPGGGGNMDDWPERGILAPSMKLCDLWLAVT